MNVTNFSSVTANNPSALGTGAVTLGTAGNGNFPILNLNGVSIANAITVTTGGSRHLADTGGQNAWPVCRDRSRWWAG